MISSLLFFIGSGIGRIVAISAVSAVVLLGGWLVLKTHYYNQGYDAALAAVDKQDTRSVDAKNRNAKKIKECRDSGREWDVPSGVCQ